MSQPHPPSSLEETNSAHVPPNASEAPPTTTSNTDSGSSSTMTSRETPSMNTWESQALNHLGSQQSLAASSALDATVPFGLFQDSLIYPGLYSASGLDIMTILIMVRNRPHPAFELGAVDCSVAMVLCDLDRPDAPIIYATDAFCELTGYARSEVLGRNCRFLQVPGPTSPHGDGDVLAVNNAATNSLRLAVKYQQEIQLQLYNYKRNGQRFVNALSIIPIRLGPNGHTYAVGFLAEV